MKKLPIGVSTFESIITDNFLYVDKTEVLYQLIEHGSRRYFLSRPRRFGKSLTCSTLNAIFTGKKELFKDLWIGKSDYNWPVRPVIQFDFSQISHKTPEALIEGLHLTLDSNAQQYGISLAQPLLKKNLPLLLKRWGKNMDLL